MVKVLHPNYRVSVDPITRTVYLWEYKPEIGLFYLVFTLTWEPAPKIVEVTYEQTLRVDCQVDFRGAKDFKGYLYAAIGSRILDTAFDEILTDKKDIAISASKEWITWKSLDHDVSPKIKITKEIEPGTYHLYAKIMDEAGKDVIISPYYENAIKVIPIAEFRELKIVDYVVLGSLST